MAFPKTLENAAAENFAVVGAGDPATEAGFILTETQLNAIESAFDTAATTATENATAIQSLTDQLATAKAEKEAAEQASAAATDNLATITAERDSWKEKAEKYGATTDNATDTGKEADTFSSETVKKNSLDEYAESMGVARF